jgi:antitoxin component YwqK of YwqJK toxin-antitoxin module
MNESGPSRPAGSARVWRWWALGIVLVGIGVVLWQGRPPASEPASELASNLVRRDGRLYSPAASAPFIGWMVEHYPDAVLKSKSWVSNGQLNGVSEGWFTNGVLQIREHFVDGTSEGPVLKWHASGAKLSEGIARRGQLEGTFRRWHESGQLAEELVLQAGQPEGVARSWFLSGCLKAEVTLKSGQVLTQKFWKDGERVPEPVFAEAGKTP